MDQRNGTGVIWREFAQMLAERGYVYEMLRRLFLLGPTVELLTEWIDLASAYHEEDAVDCSAGESELAGFLQTLELDLVEELVQALKPEFTRLFIGTCHLPAPPYESVYRSAERVLMQATTIAVREKYRDAGLAVKHLNHEPDDHIGLELEFMYYLNRQALEALTRHDLPAMLAAVGAQHRFLTGHLSQWVATFCDDITGNTCQEFFRCLAGFLKTFIREDCEQVRRFMQTGQEILADASCCAVNYTGG